MKKKSFELIWKEDVWGTLEKQGNLDCFSVQAKGLVLFFIFHKAYSFQSFFHLFLKCQLFWKLKYFSFNLYIYIILKQSPFIIPRIYTYFSTDVICWIWARFANCFHLPGIHSCQINYLRKLFTWLFSLFSQGPWNKATKARPISYS